MKEYFENFKVFIPTWVICLLAAFWFEIWTAVLCIVLLIVQHHQYKKIRERMEGSKTDPHAVKSIPENNRIADNQNPLVIKKFYFCAGRYVGGIDIPCGVYQLRLLAGEAYVQCLNDDTDGKHNAFINMSFNDSKKPSKYSGLEIFNDTIVEIKNNAKVEFSFIRNNSGYEDEEETKTEDIKEAKEEYNEFKDIDIDSMDGWQFEEFCSKILERNGFYDVDVTPKSGDFGADIIAYKDNSKYVIQCKHYSNPVGNKAVQEIFSAKTYYGADFAVVLTNNRFTNHAIEHANGTDVILWDGEYLKEMIENISAVSKEKKKTETKANAKEEIQALEYDKEKGIYPSGHYIVGEDIETGSYILTSKGDSSAFVNTCKDYESYKECEYIIDESFKGKYFLSLKETGILLVIENAIIQKI